MKNKTKAPARKKNQIGQDGRAAIQQREKQKPKEGIRTTRNHQTDGAAVRGRGPSPMAAVCTESGSRGRGLVRQSARLSLEAQCS